MEPEDHTVTDRNAGGFTGSYLIKSLRDNKIEAVRASNGMVKVTPIFWHNSISPRVKGAFQ